MFRLYGEFTMETVLATAFGYKVELLRGKVAGGDELIQATQNVFEIPIGGGMMGVTLSSLHCKAHTCSLLQFSFQNSMLRFISLHFFNNLI